MDYRHDEHLEDMVEAYRKNRDPAPLTRLITLDPDAMQAPAIGRLFLDMINDNLPKFKKPNSTYEARERAVELVLFYLGQGLNKSNAYIQAGKILNKSGDTVKGYINDWLNALSVAPSKLEDISKECKSFKDGRLFINGELAQLKLETAAGGYGAFIDGKAMVDDELAMQEIASLPHRDIAWYRKAITDLYEKQKPIAFNDPWEAQEKVWLLTQELKQLKDD
ncbi:MAG: hypothetical protein KKE94_00270 [Gammaproteobacteria bacterium]|nr:hypothetical protein [Gammaproteobacteria bacterium]